MYNLSLTLEIIELMIQKVTEYESIFFLKYNDNFCSLAENQMQPLNSKVNVLM
jgi:hypothetical protein